MRESQYIETYLDTTAERRFTPGTFLAYQLRGRAKTWQAHYLRALRKSLDRRVATGRVRKVRSERGGVSYIRTEDMQ